MKPISSLSQLGILLLVLTTPFRGPAQPAYQRPPPEVLEILRAPATPNVSSSPTRDRLLLLDWERYPSIADLAQPMLPLAGLRINPNNHGPHRRPPNIGITVQTILTGEKTPLKLPPDARVARPQWAADGKRFAFALHQPARIELWIADALTGQTRKVNGIALNAIGGQPFQWTPDSQALLCRTVPEDRGPAPAAPAVPPGPNVQESFGQTAPVRTFQDLLKNAHDEAQFEYYGAAQLVVVDAASGQIRKLGPPGLYSRVDPAPNGQYWLVSVLKKPFSRLLPASGFPTDVAVWDGDGKSVYQLASLPSEEGVPIEGVPTGPRDFHWRPTAESTLVWAEALDGGDPRTKAPHRDRLLSLRAPFREAPSELLRLEQRYRGLTWGEKDGLAFVADYDRDRRWQRTFLIRFDRPAEAPRLVWDRSVRDRYGHPGDLMMRTLPNGQEVMWQKGDFLYLAGAGASPRGDHPFLDRFDLETFKSERLFHCSDGIFESVVELVEDTSPTGLRFITRRESPAEPPNYFIRETGKAEGTALTRFADPTPQLRRITKQLVSYQRGDGVTLSFTLYLPPAYQAGQRLPTVVWAYPLEYNDPGTAGQVSGSANRFTLMGGPSHLFFLTQGYAVLDGATMPIVGPPDKMNDTFVEQIVASAKAAIDKAVEMGVTDPQRVGVGGHSYGAFMTANLLAHCDLFRAGIARSGAYNRTLTPFGFQGERRTLWEAPEIYLRLSPFAQAHKIDEPILLIHGERDDNPGTFPVQSERLYHAIKGHGGNVRYVTLPFEAHGYAARESVEHALYEMLSWFDAHVKNAAAKTTETSTGSR